MTSALQEKKQRKRVVGVGSALVDILTREGDDFLAAAGAVKGGMVYVDRDRIERTLARAGGSPHVVPGGSACNTVVGIASERFISVAGAVPVIPAGKAWPSSRIPIRPGCAAVTGMIHLSPRRISVGLPDQWNLTP